MQAVQQGSMAYVVSILSRRMYIVIQEYIIYIYRSSGPFRAWNTKQNMKNENILKTQDMD
jgi:hypothetical protein